VCVYCDQNVSARATFFKKASAGKKISPGKRREERGEILNFFQNTAKILLLSLSSERETESESEE